jgi:LysM domain
MAKDHGDRRGRRPELVTTVSPRGGFVGDGWVQIQTKEWTIECLLGDEVPQYGDITSGFAVTEVPRARGFVRWAGDQPLTATLPLLLDGWAASIGVERDRDRLINLAHGKDDERPDDFVMRGPVPLAGERVVCTGLAWGASLRGHNGQLQRQAFTLSLIEYLTPDKLKIKKRKRGGKPNTYTTKKGDTLKRIAQRLLKPNASGEEVADLARKIGKLNDIRDINRELDAGKDLRLP